MREPWRAVRRHRFGRKDREAFGTAVYSAAPRSASKDNKINVPVPFSCRVRLPSYRPSLRPLCPGIRTLQ